MELQGLKDAPDSLKTMFIYANLRSVKTQAVAILLNGRNRNPKKPQLC
jgi:hypothetical protein